MAPKGKAKAAAKAAREEEDANKVLPPDQAAFDARVKEVQDQIDGLQKKQAAIQEKINSKNVGKDDFFQKKSELRAAIDEVTERLNKIYAQIDAGKETVDNAKRESLSMKMQVEKESRMLGKFTTIDEIDKRILQINNTLQVETMTLKAEKELMAEMKELKKCKPRVSELAKSKSQLEELSMHKPAGDALNELKSEAYKCREERKVIYDKLAELTEENQAKRGGLDGEYEEKKKISEEIQALIQKRKEIRDESYEQQREYRKYQDEQRQKRQERIAGERAERQQEFEQKRRQKMADALDEQPHVEEMTLIEQTMKWCSSLVAVKETAVVKEKAEVKHDIPEGGVVLLNKNDRDEEFFFAPLKTKAKKDKNAKKKASSESIKHTAETLKNFDELKVNAPLGTKDIPATLEALEAKLNEYKEKVEVWKQQRDERKKTILAEGYDPEAVNEEAPAEKEAEAAAEE